MDLGSLIRLNHLFRLSYCKNAIDFVDQLNYQYTGGILVFFIGIISARQYFGRPIQCWVPVHYSRAWTDYAEDICWTQSTYFLPSDQDVPLNSAETQKKIHITYYQWVTIFLGLQAIIAYLPYFVWFFSSRRFSTLLITLRRIISLDQESRKRSVTLITGCIEEQLELISKDCTNNVFKRFNNKICVLFFATRLLCTVLSCLQLYLMQTFLKMESLAFGVTILLGVLKGDQWMTSGHFPRVTFCRFEIRDWNKFAAKVETIQCALTFNYFLEKMYVFLWFWFVGLALFTFVNTLIWMKRLLDAYLTDKFIGQYIDLVHKSSKKDIGNYRVFVSSFLGVDGVFLLLSISNSINDIVVMDVLNHLWALYQDYPCSQNDELNDNPNEAVV